MRLLEERNDVHKVLMENIFVESISPLSLGGYQPTKQPIYLPTTHCTYIPTHPI